MSAPTQIQGSALDAFLRFRDQDGNNLVSLNKDGSVCSVGLRTGTSLHVSTQVNISLAQMQAIHTSPLVLVPGQAGKTILVDSAYIFWDATAATVISVAPQLSINFANQLVAGQEIFADTQVLFNDISTPGLNLVQMSTLATQNAGTATAWSTASTIGQSIVLYSPTNLSGGSGFGWVSLSYHIVG